MAEYNPSKIVKDGNTYNFRDTTKIPLSGSNKISGDLIPSTDNAIDIGSSTKNIKMLYTKGITINGTQFLPSDYATLSSLSTVATSGSYNDLSNKPTIPTVNNATLTIQKNGTNVQTFTANQSTNATANITVPTKTSDLTNDSGFITSDNTKIPLAGSNQISGSLIPATTDAYDLGGSSYQWNNAYIKTLTVNGAVAGDILTHNVSEFVPRSGGTVFESIGYARTVNNSYLRLYGGTNESDGAYFQLAGNNASQSEGFARVVTGSGVIYYFENTNFAPSNHPALGAPGYEWGQIYSTNSTISTSDARLKNNIKDIDNKLLDAWGNIEPKQYKFNDATEKKGEKARLHTGYIAQDIQAECEKQGVNASDYGLFCYDEWEEQEEKKDENGQVIEPYRAKGDLYALRYEEALVVECKYLRRCIARLTARIEELEKRE